LNCGAARRRNTIRHLETSDRMMIMRKSWTSLFAAAALAIIVLVMVVQFAPSVLGAAMAVTDFG
jgi:hypothetical protein